MPMMDCGHEANSVRKGKGGEPDRPACVICIHTKPGDPEYGLREVKYEVPEGRRARCVSYGRHPGRRGSCDYGCPEGHKRGDVCRCEAPADPEKLPFFEMKPDEEYDRFYCGCSCGWD